MSTWIRYSSWLISSAARAGDSCSAAIQASAASSTTFLPWAWIPSSSATTVAEPVGRSAWRRVSSANSSSKVFISPRAYRARLGSLALLPPVRPGPGGAWLRDLEVVDRGLLIHGEVTKLGHARVGGSFWVGGS